MVANDEEDSKPITTPLWKKKNTWWRKAKAWLLRFDRRQQYDRLIPQVDETQHTCRHCGAAYQGRYCPQCSMPARWQQFDWKLLSLNFLDIWGFGNRPMFRSLRDLFWRPGYMMRDYIKGHHLSFFPPFKMLAVLTIILLFVAMLMNAQLEEHYALGEFLNDKVPNPSARGAALIELIDRLEGFLQDNVLYRVILMNVLLVFAVKVAFYGASRLNIIETFFTQIYINCQFQIIAIIILLFTGVIYHSEYFPYAVDGSIIFPLLVYDFKQLYEIPWWSAIVRTAFVGLLMSLMLGSILFISLGFVLLVDGL